MADENWFLKYTQGTRRGSEREGVLMRIEENEHSRYEFEVWFEYTRQAMNDIREGTMLAVPNYASTKDEQHASILEVTSIKPIHYAIGEKPEGFPGFVLEAAKNAAIDWTGQDDEPTEDTTTIRCTAIPTNLELYEDKSGSRTFFSEENIPMVGAVVRILDTEPTKKVVNQNIDLEREQQLLFTGGTLIRDDRVPVFVRVEEFLRLHFGVFGFTGAGKSNLLSTYISKLLTSKTPMKIVLFDLMGEYTALLVDLINSDKIKKARVIALGDQTLPEPVVRFIKKVRGAPTAEEAADFLNRVTLLPTDLQKHKPQMKLALRKVLDESKIKIFSEVENYTIWYLFYDYKSNRSCPISYKNRRSQEIKDKIKAVIKAVLTASLKSPRDYVGSKDYERIVLSKELAEDLLTSMAAELAKAENKEVTSDFEGVTTKINIALPQLSKITPASISMSEIISDLNNDDDAFNLYVITAHDPDGMRVFAEILGNELYESRRRTGSISPLVSIIFDEADEFIPQDAKGSYVNSKAVIRTIARRGRKFGVGFGIATQRVRYLDTSIMAQPHTYLVSKLPRQTDRDVVAEAFGVSSDMFRQTFKFKPGDWLVMSHDATGLKAVPLPLHLENANERVKFYLEGLRLT